MVVVMNLWWGDRRRWFDFTLLHSLLHKDHDYRFWRGRRKFSSHICSFLCFTKFHVIHTACAVEWWRMIYSVFDGEPAILWSAENFPYSTLHYCGVWLYVSVFAPTSVFQCFSFDSVFAPTHQHCVLDSASYLFLYLLAPSTGHTWNNQCMIEQSGICNLKLILLVLF